MVQDVKKVDQSLAKIDGIEEKDTIRNIKDTEEVDQISGTKKPITNEEGTDQKEAKVRKPSVEVPKAVSNGIKAFLKEKAIRNIKVGVYQKMAKTN